MHHIRPLSLSLSYAHLLILFVHTCKDRCLSLNLISLSYVYVHIHPPPPPPPPTHTHTFTHSQTPTNYHPPITSATASTRSVAGSPAVSHEEDFREIIVLAENAKNETLLCPLCQGVFRDPYIATCGVRSILL